MNITLMYDGPALAKHAMDVNDFAPALMAFSNLCKEANREINGETSSVTVMINADLKANCVTISLDIVQYSTYVATLLPPEDTINIKDIISYIIGGSGTIVGVLGLLAQIKNNKIKSAAPSTDIQGNNVVNITVEGNDNIITVTPAVHKLANNSKVVTELQKVLLPAANNEGISVVAFKDNESNQTKINKTTAKDICSISTVNNDEETDETSIVTAHIITHSPVFDTNSKNWSFDYNGRIESIDISDTTIARDSIERRKYVIGDTYKVRMQVTQKKAGKSYRNHYKVIQVLDFTPGKEQGILNL